MYLNSRLPYNLNNIVVFAYSITELGGAPTRTRVFGFVHKWPITILNLEFTLQIQYYRLTT